MAQGDVVFFDQALVGMMDGTHDFDTHTFNLALITSSATPTPAADVADPRWGTGGTTNYSTYQASIVGAYTGPVALTGASVSLNGTTDLAELDFADPSTWSQNGSSPTDVRWGIIYNNTAAGKQCICYIDLGSTFDMQTGDLTITWGTPFATLNQA